MKMASRGVNARVPTALPMALGASVHPLTKTTPNTKTMLEMNAKSKTAPFVHRWQLDNQLFQSEKDAIVSHCLADEFSHEIT
jgi:hypothetical protein